MEDAKRNYLSDNQLEMTICTEDGALVAPADMWMKIHLRCGGREFTAIYDPEGEETRNCHVENEVLVIDIPGRRLNPGMVECMIEVREKCEYFNNGYKNTHSLSYQPIGITFV